MSSDLKREIIGLLKRRRGIEIHSGWLYRSSGNAEKIRWNRNIITICWKCQLKHLRIKTTSYFFSNFNESVI